ncbi:hypothetical protein Pla123a_16110 [Posidoniimonas polymericola]|uniref:Uncharacterized protein n=1 Tax=Posidoniimonas polymericola TaxID=2528002 RepID=A0A5C5YS95_9BACT|nr:hypothetical protein [Posidoniimonas polymericola]TWT77815.1 hypothetical protein Pla123a_16110 [Posidoniimonas polymericola]
MPPDAHGIDYSRYRNAVLSYGRPVKSDWGVMRPQDFGVIELLDQLDAALKERQQAHESAAELLLSLRPIFRDMAEEAPRTGLRRWLALRGLDRPAAPVAVWLLGRYSTSTSTKRLAELADQPMPAAFARHYARTLRRLCLWAPLDKVAVKYKVDWCVRRQAEPRRVPPFSDRLKRFSANVDQSRAASVPERSRMPLWLSAEFWFRRPGKTAQAIREVLDRIRSLVHGA